MKADGIVTLLQSWKNGDATARDALFGEVYDDLRVLARRHMLSENAGHTLQATALVHEAYERLADSEIDWRDRAHFMAVVSQVIRRLLVDHARGRRRTKRGGEQRKLSLDDIAEVAAADGTPMLELDEALRRLGQHDARKEQVLELHYFGGLTQPKIAEALGISPATVDRDLRMGRAWVKRAMDGAEG